MIKTFLIKKIIILQSCGGSQSLSLCLCVRDDLFRVELDNVVGEEMFYNKVRTESTNTHTHTYFMMEMNSPSLTKFPLLQKRTWESNKNDIRICRMKGKHEVSGCCHKQKNIFGLYVRNIQFYGRLALETTFWQ